VQECERHDAIDRGGERYRVDSCGQRLRNLEVNVRAAVGALNPDAPLAVLANVAMLRTEPDNLAATRDGLQCEKRPDAVATSMRTTDDNADADDFSIECPIIFSAPR
jgi:hypothetical protein